MSAKKTESVSDYIAAQPKPNQAALRKVRSAIRQAVPKATEGISYQIPTYKLEGAPVLFFAGWKTFYSLYPMSDALLAAFAGKLSPGVLKQRTLRFPFTEPVPMKLIARLAKFRAKELVHRTPAGAVARAPGKATNRPKAR